MLIFVQNKGLQKKIELVPQNNSFPKGHFMHDNLFFIYTDKLL